MLECILNEIMTKKKKRILIIRCGLLGDTIDSTAVVKPLVDHYGDELEIDWVTKPNLEKLFQYDTRIEPIIIRFTKLPLLFNFDKLKIIYLSNLMTEKGIFDLLEALDILTKNNVKFEAKIAGGIDVSIEAEIQQKLNTSSLCVDYLGLVYSEDKKNMLEYLLVMDREIQSNYLN